MVVYQKYSNRTFKTAFWVQNHLWSLFSWAVNSQRLFCSKKAGIKCSYQILLVSKKYYCMVCYLLKLFPFFTIGIVLYERTKLWTFHSTNTKEIMFSHSNNIEKSNELLLLSSQERFENYIPYLSKYS